MRYFVAAAIGITAFLLLNGIKVASHAEATAESVQRPVVYIETNNDTAKLEAEVEKLKTLSSIREVLEVYHKNATLEDKRELAETIYDSCKLFDLDVELVLAVIQTESSFNPDAISNKGALGLMQLMPSTGIAMSQELALEGVNRSSLFDHKTNVVLGCYYLKKLINRYDGNIERALAAYNAGPTRLDLTLSSKNDIPQGYSSKVRGHMSRIAKLHFDTVEESN